MAKFDRVSITQAQPETVGSDEIAMQPRPQLGLAAQGAVVASRIGVDADPTGRKIAQQIPAEDVMLELVAQWMAYANELTPQDVALITRWGYEPTPIFVRGRAGVIVAGLRPRSDAKVNPVVAFRGTDGDGLAGALKASSTKAGGAMVKAVMTGADASKVAASSLSGAGDGLKHMTANLDAEIGGAAFQANATMIGDLLGMLDRPVVTGHSLGGALAQLAAVHFPDRVRRVVTFNAPGISAANVAQLAARGPNQQPAVTHHREKRDLVSVAGEAHLPGAVYDHDVTGSGGVLSAHSAWLLLAPQFAAQRVELGLDEATINEAFTSHGMSPEKIARLAKSRSIEGSVARSDLDPSQRSPMVERMRRWLGDGAIARQVRALSDMVDAHEGEKL